MASSLNKMMLIGNVGRDPEMRYMPNGNPVTNFSVAVNRNRTSPEGERREETEWFRIVTYTKLAEICNQYVKKGGKVYVEGRIQVRTYDGQDGLKHTIVEVIANDVQMLDSRPRTGDESGGAEVSAGRSAPAPSHQPAGRPAPESDQFDDAGEIDPGDAPF